MSIVRLAVGLAAATAAAVMFSSKRKKTASSGTSPGSDSRSTSSMPGSAVGTSMTGGEHDDLLSPSSTGASLGAANAAEMGGRTSGL